MTRSCLFAGSINTHDTASRKQKQTGGSKDSNDTRSTLRRLVLRHSRANTISHDPRSRMHPAHGLGPQDRLHLPVRVRIDEKRMFGRVDVVPVIYLWDRQAAIERWFLERLAGESLSIGEGRNGESV